MDAIFIIALLTERKRKQPNVPPRGVELAACVYSEVRTDLTVFKKIICKCVFAYIHSFLCVQRESVISSADLSHPSLWTRAPNHILEYFFIVHILDT